MAIRVSIIGYDLLGKRLVDAVACQQDMEIAGVFEDDPLRCQMLAARGYPCLAGNHQQLAAEGDVAVVCRDDCQGVNLPLVVVTAQARSLDGPLFSSIASAASIHGQPVVRIGVPDILAIARLVKIVGTQAKITRLFANVITRCSHATLPAAGSVDAVEPLPGDPWLNRQLAELLAGHVDSFQMHQVRVPYSHSHLQTLKLDLDAPIEPEQLLGLLKSDRRILVDWAMDGYTTTADVQEHFRDSPRARADRPELFVWGESVMIRGTQLYLMMDVCQESTVVPETMDAIRLSRRPSMDVSEAMQQTDSALGLGLFWSVEPERALRGVV